MKTDIKLRQAVMRRVYGVYVLRLLAAPRTHILGFLAAAIAIVSTVSVNDVFQNAASAMHSPVVFFNYLVSAFATAETLVVFSTIMALLFGIFLMRRACVFCFHFGLRGLKRAS